MSLAFRMPCLRPEVVQWRNALLKPSLRQWLNDLGLNFNSNGPPHLGDGALTLFLEADGQLMQVLLPAFAWPEGWLICELLNSDRREEAVAVLLGRWSAALRRVGLAKVCWRLESGCEPPDPHSGIGATIDSIDVWVQVDGENKMSSWARRLQDLELPESPANSRLRMISSSLRMDCATLSGNQFKRVRQGDVLLCRAAAMTTQHWHTWMGIGIGRSRAVIRCQIDGCQILITGRWMALDGIDWGLDSLGRTAEMNERHSAEDNARPAVLEEVNLPVCVEVAGPALTLRELQELSPGQVLRLELPLEAVPARLFVAGHSWARGELVAVGDALGVRITQLT